MDSRKSFTVNVQLISFKILVNLAHIREMKALIPVRYKAIPPAKIYMILQFVACKSLERTLTS
jgi:hypothetical protein